MLSTITTSELKTRLDLTKFEGAIGLLESQYQLDSNIHKKYPFYVCGGAVRAVINNEPISDFDIFFQEEKYFKDFIERVKKIRGFIEEDRQLPTCYSFSIKREKEIYKYQAVSTLYGTIETILDSFDFVCCQVGYQNNIFYYYPLAMLDIVRKRITINKISKPISTLRRLIKYSQKGYYACTGALLEVCKQIPNLEIDTKSLYID